MNVEIGKLYTQSGVLLKVVTQLLVIECLFVMLHCHLINYVYQLLVHVLLARIFSYFKQSPFMIVGT